MDRLLNQMSSDIITIISFFISIISLVSIIFATRDELKRNINNNCSIKRKNKILKNLVKNIAKTISCPFCVVTCSGNSTAIAKEFYDELNLCCPFINNNKFIVLHIENKTNTIPSHVMYDEFACSNKHILFFKNRHFTTKDMLYIIFDDVSTTASTLICIKEKLKTTYLIEEKNIITASLLTNEYSRASNMEPNYSGDTSKISSIKMQWRSDKKKNSKISKQYKEEGLKLEEIYG